MIQTGRIKIYPAALDQMRAVITSELDEGLRAAYGQMLDGCLQHPDQYDWYAMWMIERKDGTHIGDLCFKGVPVNGAVEIGYGLFDEYRGQGYAVEAVQAAVKWALDQPGVNRVEAETEPDNKASQSVLGKCGFRPSDIAGEEGPRFSKEKER